MPSLTRIESTDRFDLIDVTSYEVDLDLDQGDQLFGSVTTVRFAAARPGAASWIDLRAKEIHELTLNGAALDPASVVEGRLPLPHLAADNVLHVRATMSYRRDGQGFHRSIDPADGRHYVYGHLFLDAAPTVYACFDQPDLKAPYTVSVRAPEDWIVIGNGAATRGPDGIWRLATTAPLATYFVTVCAGPYASVYAEHDGIALGIHGRQSLRAALEGQGDQILEITRRSFDYYHGLFGIRYPFGEYHQVFVPEFNAGAMENPGCVTFRDQFLFRGAATRAEVLTRANTIAHEMAHMWFGDLVTMKWWDDLWLNESFAEYMASRTLVAATEFTDAWVQSGSTRKAWGYAAERSPSAHPVAGSPAPDAESALHNFDGISYAKGSSALRQLIAYVGDESFVAGVSAYLRELAYGNGTFAEFLAAVERASGRDLGEWTRGWLLTTGRDRIGVELTEAADGMIAAAEVVRTPPVDHPADRPHIFELAGFDGGSETFRFPVRVVEERTALPELVGRRRPALVVPNADDLTWAAVAFDPRTAAGLADGLGLIGDANTRAMVWTALEDAVDRAEFDPREFLRAVAVSWPLETNVSVLSRVSLGSLLPGTGAFGIAERYLPLAEREAGLAAIAGAATGLLAECADDDSRLLPAAKALVATTADPDLLGRWLNGEGLPTPLVGDADFHWAVVLRAATLGLVDASGIQAFLDADDTLTGKLAALTARAALPDARDKAWAWREIVTDSGRSNYELNALAHGFWLCPPVDLVQEYAERYFVDIPLLSSWVGEDALARVVTFAFPSVIDDAVVAAAAATLDRTDLTPAVRRSLVDADALAREVLASRAAFPGTLPAAG